MYQNLQIWLKTISSDKTLAHILAKGYKTKAPLPRLPRDCPTTKYLAPPLTKIRNVFVERNVSECMDVRTFGERDLRGGDCDAVLGMQRVGAETGIGRHTHEQRRLHHTVAPVLHNRQTIHSTVTNYRVKHHY